MYLFNRPVVLAELMHHSEQGGDETFDYLNFSRENVLWLVRRIGRGSRPELYLELPNACDLLEERGISISNVTRFYICYLMVERTLLRLEMHPSKHYEPVPENLFEGTRYGEILKSAYPGYSDQLIASIDKVLSDLYAETKFAFKLSIESSPSGETYVPVGGYYFERHIIIEDDAIIAHLNFIDRESGEVIVNFQNFFVPSTLEPICASELEHAYGGEFLFFDGHFELFISNILMLKTN